MSADFEHDEMPHQWVHPETGVRINCEDMPRELEPQEDTMAAKIRILVAVGDGEPVEIATQDLKLRTHAIPGNRPEIAGVTVTVAGRGGIRGEMRRAFRRLARAI